MPAKLLPSSSVPEKCWAVDAIWVETQLAPGSGTGADRARPLESCGPHLTSCLSGRRVQRALRIEGRDFD